MIERYQFKQDRVGYLTTKRQHLYVLDLATKKVEALTPGNFDEYLPSWSPDGKRLAFVSNRGTDPDRDENFDIWLIDAKPGAVPQRLTTYRGADADPSWESRPAWRPDGKAIAYLLGMLYKIDIIPSPAPSPLPAHASSPPPALPLVPRHRYGVLAKRNLHQRLRAGPRSGSGGAARLCGSLW